MKKFVKVSLYVILVKLALATLMGAAICYQWSSNLPYISSLRNYNPPVITEVFADDGQIVGQFWDERRILVPLDKISGHLVNAFIATEDARFFQHKGIDYLGTMRALFKNIKAGRIRQGGSTITQQVARSILLKDFAKTYKRKVREILLSLQIEKEFSKEEILYLYLNQIYLGHGLYGVEAASQVYFGKKANELTIAQSALLAGLARAPSRSSPIKHLGRAKVRQKYVLDRMKTEGFIDDRQFKKALATKLEIQPNKKRRPQKAPYFLEYVRQNIERKYGRLPLYRGGLKIYTTVNLKMQTAAEDAIRKGLREFDKREESREEAKDLSNWALSLEQMPKAQAALICLEAKTGYVKAMVGGLDFSKSQFNRAVQARRQPGSAFKPIIYAAALDKGFTPSSVIVDSPFIASFNNGKEEETWKPRNYKEKFYGRTLFRTGLIKSRNVITVKILNEIGVNYAIAYARRMGIKSPLNADLSLALGSSGVSLVELTKAYSVFANGGMLIEPIFITKVIDRHGNILEENQTSFTRAISRETAYIMTDLLKAVVKEGTGWRVKALRRLVAGKTGTTNNLWDAWFLGFDPTLITGVWVGYDDRRPMSKGETGSRTASPIWLHFMKEALRGRPRIPFQSSKNVVITKIDTKTGLLATSFSKKARFQAFKKGTEPTNYSPRPNQGKRGEFFSRDMDHSSR